MFQAPKSECGWYATCKDTPSLCQELQAEMCRFSEQNTAQAFEKELVGLALLGCWCKSPSGYCGLPTGDYLDRFKVVKKSQTTSE